MMRVAVYGANLVMSCLCTGLHRRPELGVRGIEDLPSDGVRTPRTALPEVILFNLAGSHPAFVIPLLQERPTTLPS